MYKNHRKLSLSFILFSPVLCNDDKSSALKNNNALKQEISKEIFSNSLTRLESYNSRKAIYFSSSDASTVPIEKYVPQNSKSGIGVLLHLNILNVKRAGLTNYYPTPISYTSKSNIVN